MCLYQTHQHATSGVFKNKNQVQKCDFIVYLFQSQGSRHEPHLHRLLSSQLTCQTNADLTFLIMDNSIRTCKSTRMCLQSMNNDDSDTSLWKMDLCFAPANYTLCYVSVAPRILQTAASFDLNGCRRLVKELG